MSVKAQSWFEEVFHDHFAIGYRIEGHLHHSVSPFQTIDVCETSKYGKLLALDGAIMLTERDEHIYHEMLVHVPLLSHEDPKRILVVGGGDGGTVREVLQHDTVDQVDMVEIDEDVVKVCRRYLPALSGKLDDPRVKLFFQDAVEFVKGLDGVYDAALIDSTDPAGPGEVLFTEDFYRDVLRALKPGGVVALQSESPFSLEGEMGMIYRRLAAVFPYAAIYWAPIPCYPYGTWSFMFCSRDGQGPDIRRPEAAQKTESRCKYYNPDIHWAAFVLPNFMRDFLPEKKR